MQPAFTAAPKAIDSELATELLRVPARGISNAQITSHDPLGCWTHFVGGRTLPCTDPECQWCDDGESRRWYGWLGIIIRRTNKPYLLTYTAAASQQIQVAYENHGTLRGSRIDCYRLGDRPNGRLKPIIWPPTTDEPELPPPPDRKRILMHIWEAPHRVALERRLGNTIDNATDERQNLDRQTRGKT